MVRRQAVNTALIDMDGTICDYNRQLLKDLRKLATPGEPEFTGEIRDAPLYLQKRADLIRSSQEWWENLPRLQLGWDVLKIAQELEYRIMILTQGPSNYPTAWIGKKLWIDKNLPGVDMTITRDKSLMYGKVLVDDFPGYIDGWLTWRKNGLVVMPVNESNKDYSHPQVIPYDGTNLEEVRRAMEMRLKGAHRKDTKS